MKLLPILLLCLALPVYAHDRKPPESIPINVPDDGSNHNALLLGVVVIAVVCIYHKCWKPKPVKATGSSVPEIPRNEFTYEIKP